MDENNQTARRDGESDEAYQARITELQAGLARILPADAPLADAPQQQADADARIVAQQQAADNQVHPMTDTPERVELRWSDTSGASWGDATAAASVAASFAARIAAAKFEHREQGHDETMKLLDEMLAAITRIEAQRG